MTSQSDNANEHKLTGNEGATGLKPVELHVEAQLDGLQRDQEDQVHDWYRTYMDQMVQHRSPL